MCQSAFLRSPRGAKGLLESSSGFPDQSFLSIDPSVPVFAYLCHLFQKWHRWTVKYQRPLLSAPRGARGFLESSSDIPDLSLQIFYPYNCKKPYIQNTYRQNLGVFILYQIWQSMNLWSQRAQDCQRITGVIV